MESNTEATVENVSAATNTEAPALPDTSSAMSKTTTISTIAVHSGNTRLVIALLHCGDWMQLKILEVTPELTKLGNTVAEALELQKAHDEVLRQLQNKQSPVEELLRQADQLISTQKPRAEVYAAMAESLGRAWKDINSHLELRKQILDLNVQYHLKAQEFFDTIKTLESICADTAVPIDAATIKNFLTNIHDLRKSLLEFLMGSLQIGNLLLSKLRELGAEGTLDSRPDRIRISVNQAVSQVQSWLDQLHAKRQLLEVLFNRRKAQLEQCLALAILASDLRDLEEALKSGRDCLLNTYQLGDSSSSAELLLMENKKLLPGAKHLQDQALKITKATEQLVASGCFAGEKATEQAYTVLSDTTDYLTEIENRSSLLERVIAFFKAAENALTKLDELEIQLTSNALSLTPSELSRLHERCSNSIEELTSETIAEGYSILDIVGPRQLEAIGIQNKVEELENKKISLQSVCTAHHEEKLRINKSLNDFLEQHNLLYSWLVSAAQTFLQDHQDMGSDLPSARDFWNLHNRLLLDLQTKGNEINALLLTLPPVLEYLEDNQRRDVDSKVEDLHQLWLKLKNLLELRLDLAAIYVKFHTEASIVNNEMDKLENAIKISSKEIDDEKVQKLEEHWESLVPLYQSAKNTGITFINTANKVSESYLDVKRACTCVEAVLEKLTGRQLVITREWQSFQTDIVERKELLVEVEINMVESTKTITWVSKLDTQLYPVITTLSEDPNEILPHLHLKLETTLAEIKRAQNEIEHRTQTIDNLLAKSTISDDQILNIKNKLIELNRMLNDIRNEYQFLLQRLLSYFGNVSDLDKNIDNINAKFNEYVFSNKVSDVESVIKEHETSKQQILGLFKYIQNECEKLSSQIIKTEPTTAAKHDIEKLQYVLRIRRDKCYQEWNNRRNKLDTQKHLSQFDSDLSQINETVNDIGKQVADVKEQFCDNLPVAKAKSQAFAYFEDTVKMLGQRIDTFTKDAVKLQGDDKISQHIEEQIRKLNERWRNLQTQINDTRKLLDITIEYFQLVDEANEWFKHGSQVLVTIARKTTKVKTPEEAEKLLTAIEEFLKPGELKQTERIKQIFILANEIYGPQLPLQSSQVASDNREMLESFASITNELQLLLSNLNVRKDEHEPLEIETPKENSEIIITPIITEPVTSTCHIKQIITTIPVTSEAKFLPSIEPVVTKSETQKSEHVEENNLGEQTTTEIIEIVKITTINREQPHKIEIGNQVKPPIFISHLTDAVIEEGSKFSFVCQVEGEPTPSVTWFKDGIAIENNPDYQTTFDDGLCTLKIEETFAEDSAKYACKAVNLGGSAETDAFLMVKETHPCEQLIPPNFIIRLQPLQIKQGQSFQLYCKVEGNPLPTVQWYKNDECIDNFADYVITYNNGEALLKCEEEFLIDKAEYTCKASNQVGIAQSTTTINVEPQQQTEYPLFVTPLSNVMARAGQKIKLECEVSGVPIPSITWSHNGKPVKETHELKVHFDNKKATLLISEAFLKDTGVYVVKARNNAGESYSECTVTVKGRLPTETSDSEIASDMEPIKPSIQVPLKDITEVENSKVCLDCVIVGQPEPEVIWYHDERPVKESPDFQLLFQGDRCSLVIREAIIGDSGEYKVVALNSAGEASSKCKLTIKPLVEKIEETQPIEETSKPTGSSPKFEKLLTDVLASEGEKVTFETKVTGVPHPTVKWSLNNVELQDNECTTITYDDEGNAKLEIDKVLPSHKGVYTVKATNDVGDVKCFAQLIVKSSKPVEPEKLKTIPAFIEVFSDRTVTEDSPTKFECTVIGEPTPKITWILNSKPVTGEDFQVSSSGDKQVLLVSKVKTNLKGKITCLAENEAGKAECSALLTVNLPIDVSNNIVKCDIVQNGNSSYTVQKEIVMQSTTSSTSQITTNSSTQEPQLALSGFVAQDSQTVKQINQQEPEIIESHVFEKFHQIDGKPPIIDEKSVSTLTIKEESKPQEVDITAQIVQKASKARPPKFTSPIMGKIVDQGVDVVLEGIIDGSPTPVISWEKNGAELESGEHVEILFDHNRVQIKINEVTTNDSGRYTCKAVNEAGSAISTSDLVVKKTTFPPVFGRRLQAQVVKKGDRVHMDVEVTGIPTPEVTWFKDDKPIQDVLKNNFKLSTQGNSYSLLIEKADINHTGKYMVTAINEGGEAQSIADFAVFEPTPDTMVEVVKTVVFEDVHKHETLTTEHTKESLVIPENVPMTDVIVDLPNDKASPQPAVTKPIELVDAPCSNVIDIKQSSQEIKVSIKSEIAKPVEEEPKHVEISVELKPVEEKSKSLDDIVTESFQEIKPVIQEVELEIKPESESIIIDTESSQEIKPVSTEIQQLEEKSTCVGIIEPESLVTEKPLTPEVTKTIEEKLACYSIDHTKTPQEIEQLKESKEIITSTQMEPHYSSIIDTESSKEIKVFKLESTTSNFSSELSVMPKVTHIPIDINKANQSIQEPVDATKIPTEIELENEGIQTTSISKQSSLNFFVQKLKEGEEPSQLKELPKAIPLQPEIYTKFENTSQKTELCFPSQPINLPKFESTFQKPELPLTSHQETFSNFDLQPEPPATIHFAPRISDIQEQRFSQDISTSSYKSNTLYESYGTHLKTDVLNQPIRPVSPKPSLQGLEMEKLWVPHKELEKVRPVSTLPSFNAGKESFRPISSLSEPSSEGLAMEKNWAHKFSESVTESKPLPETNSWSTQTTLERKWEPIKHVTKSFHSKSENTMKTSLPAPYYVATVTDLHEKQFAEQQSSIISQFNKEEVFEKKIIEDSGKKVSEVIKSWPPPSVVEESVPSRATQTPVFPTSYATPYTVPSSFGELYLEPGSPPEIGYAQPPPEFKSTHREMVKHFSQNESSFKQVVPPPLPPKQEKLHAPPIPDRVSKQNENRNVEIFPPRLDTPQFKLPKVQSSPTPSKFIRGRYGDSDYESDFESTRIPIKWTPSCSDTEEPQYRKVRAPNVTYNIRSKSVEPEQLPPSQYVKQNSVRESIKTFENIESKNLVENRLPTTQFPTYKIKPNMDGYMADTDEPFTLQRLSKSEYKHEETLKQNYYSSNLMTSQDSQNNTFYEQRFVSKPTPSKSFKKHVPSSNIFKKELIATPIITRVTTNKKLTSQDDRESSLEPFPFKAEPYRSKQPKAPPPPSPSKFIKGEFRESDYESDYDGRFSSTWRASAEPCYKPVRPILTPSGRQSQGSVRTPTPPSEFDKPPRFTGPPRPKFEPIEKPKTFVKINEVLNEKSSKSQIVHKPKPVTPKVTTIITSPVISQNDIVLQPGSPPEIAFASEPTFTQFYKSTTSKPHQNAVQTETSNVMHFKESTESSRRTVSLQQTKKIITFGNQQKSGEKLQTVPNKFKTNDFKESDYDSEVEMTKIKSSWGKNDTSESRYRRVQPPQISSGRYSSTPTTFKPDTPKQNYEPPNLDLQPGSPPEYGYIPTTVTPTKATKLASKHMDDMTHAFKSKTQQFVSDIITDVNKKTSETSIEKSKNENVPQVYREDSRATQYGTKHVDPDTGLIYFKYDFGYEFGVILPGQSRGGEIPVPQKTVIEPPKRTKDIEMPVYHESVQIKPKSNFSSSVKHKSVKWEPTSESEMSEYESDGRKKSDLISPRWEQYSSSPVSLSPSLPSTSPAFNTAGLETSSAPGRSLAQIGQKRPPSFITPLKDIAAICGETARFECIVQSEPLPTVLWAKNGRIIENSNDYQIFFRNGVCRLTIPQAYPEDAGTYTCTATNQNGAIGTTATLQVPGERRSQYLQ